MTVRSAPGLGADVGLGDAAELPGRHEIVTLYRVFLEAYQFNAGLDLAQAARGGDARGLRAEWIRTGLKARRLRPGPIGVPSRWDEAMGLWRAHRDRSWRQRAWALLTGRG